VTPPDEGYLVAAMRWLAVLALVAACRPPRCPTLVIEGVAVVLP